MKIPFALGLELWNLSTRKIVGVDHAGDVVHDLTPIGGAAIAAGAPLALNEGSAIAQPGPDFFDKHRQVADFLRTWADVIGEPGGNDLRTLWDQSCRVPANLTTAITALGGAAAQKRIPLTLALVRWHDYQGLPVPPEIGKVQEFLREWASSLEGGAKAAEETRRRLRRGAKKV